MKYMWLVLALVGFLTNGCAGVRVYYPDVTPPKPLTNEERIQRCYASGILRAPYDITDSEKRALWEGCAEGVQKELGRRERDAERFGQRLGRCQTSWRHRCY